jgi:hypothetical protein
MQLRVSSNMQAVEVQQLLDKGHQPLLVSPVSTLVNAFCIIIL